MWTFQFFFFFFLSFDFFLFHILEPLLSFNITPHLSKLIKPFKFYNWKRWKILLIFFIIFWMLSSISMNMMKTHSRKVQEFDLLHRIYSFQSRLCILVIICKEQSSGQHLVQYEVILSEKLLSPVRIFDLHLLIVYYILHFVEQTIRLMTVINLSNEEKQTKQNKTKKKKNVYLPTGSDFGSF